MKPLLIVLMTALQILMAKTPPPKGPILSQTVGTAAFQVVTSREVKASNILNQIFKNKTPENYQELSENGINQTLFELAIFRESQSLSAVKLSDEELKKLVQETTAVLQKRSDWKKLEASDLELKTWIERKKIAMTYFDLKMNSLIGIVTEDEIQQYFEKNRVKFGSTSFDSQKESIRVFLQKQNQKLRIQEWVAALKVKYQVRNDALTEKAP
jgi:hypothetical protein